jgi:hypothetical protein
VTVTVINYGYGSAEENCYNSYGSRSATLLESTFSSVSKSQQGPPSSRLSGQDPTYLPTVTKIFKNVCFEEDKTPEETHLVYTELNVSLDTSHYLFEPNAGIGRRSSSKEKQWRPGYFLLMLNLAKLPTPCQLILAKPLPAKSAVLRSGAGAE